MDFADSEFDHDVLDPSTVEEQQINVAVIAADVEVDMLDVLHEGRTGAVH